MLLMNLILGSFMMGTFINKFDLLVESTPMHNDDPVPNYEDTTEFYTVRSLKKANNDSSFIKLAFVVDQTMYSGMKKNSGAVARYCQKMLMLANSLFQPYNIFIALVDIIIWPESDKINISRWDINVTHTTFETHARDLFENNHSIDHIILLSYKLETKNQAYFTSFGIVDKTCKLSIGVMKWEYMIELDANRLILLLGLSLRMAIDEDIKQCVEHGFLQCRMNSTNYDEKHCIDKVMDEIAKRRINLSCWKTKPDTLYKKPACGNNVTEPGEECDCTWWDEEAKCDNQCCNAATCRPKKANYSCAFGECCHLNSCSKKLKKYHICRPISHPCDVEEYCDGEEKFCPKDKFVNESEECSVRECHNLFIDDGVVFCREITDYKGVCNSKGRCQVKKKISSPICETNATDTSTTIPSSSSISSKFYSSDSQLTSTTVRFNPSISSKFYGSDSQLTSTTVHSDSSIPVKCDCPDSSFSDFSKWKTYFYLAIVVVLMIGIKFSSHLKKHYLCFYTQSQPQVNYGMMNESRTSTIRDNQRSTVTALNSIQMDSLGHREHGYDQLNSAPNTYANPNQQGESISLYNYSSNAVIYAEIAFPPQVRAVQQNNNTKATGSRT